MVDECALYDIGYEGIKYTWYNRRGMQNNISKRLERFLASNGWFSLYPNPRFVHGTTTYMGHVPIIIHVNDGNYNRRWKRLFRFEAL